MSIELTQMSADEYEKISSGMMTPSMAAEYLKEGRIALREFPAILRSMYDAPDLQQKLTDAFAAASPDSNPASVGKKVRNWLNGQNKPTNREDIFILAFALGLTESQTSALLGHCTEYGIHYRNGRELVYAWFLRNGRTYQQANAFYESLQESDGPGPEVDRQLTRQLQSGLLFVQTEDELRSYYLENQPLMGHFHMRAYYYFERYLKQLTNPVSALGDGEEANYSLDAVMEQYLTMCMPSGKDRKGYSVGQKLIKKNWPNTTALKNIRARKEDVPRKLLLLLYVITENIIDDDYNELDEDYMTLEDRMEDHWWTLNAILNDCGMPQIDPRNASDWLVLYAITAMDEPMSERMEQVIEYMFAE